MQDGFRGVGITGNHRQTAGCGLKNHLWRSFPCRGKEKNVGAAVFAPERSGIERTQQLNIPEILAVNTPSKFGRHGSIPGDSKIDMRKPGSGSEKDLRLFERP